MHEHTLIWSSPKANHACPELGIEPAPGLVMSLSDKVGRPPLIKLFPGLWEFQGSPGSNSRVKPDIKNVFYTLLFSAAFTRESDLIHIGPMKFDISACPGLFQQFGFGSYYLKFSALFTFPDRNRNSPVALSGDTPIPSTFNPGSESG